MNDTEILDHLMKWMKPYVDGNHPAPPISIGYALTWIEIQRGDQRKARRKVTHTIHDPKNHDYDEHCACGPCDKVRSHQRKPEFGSAAPKAEGSTVCRYCFYGPDECYCTGAKQDQLQLRGRAKDATPATSTRAHVEPCRLETDHKGPCGIPSVVRHGGVPTRTAGGPYLTAADVQWGEREKRMASDILNRAFADPEQPQAFWRCKHYPVATHNWATREQCEWGCHNHSPTWDSNGDSK